MPEVGWTSASSALTRFGRVLPPVVSLPLRARFGRSREQELAVLAAFVRAGDTVVDVGAHKGVYTWRLVRLVGATGQVIAYEPQPEMISYLRAASTRGPMGRVELRPYALSDAPGHATLSVPITEGIVNKGQATLQDVGDGSQSHQVEVRTLDGESFPGPVRLMKIDVEGHELALLRGAEALLRRDLPTLLVEVEYRHSGERVAAVAALLLDELGYRASELDDAGRLALVERARWDSGEQLNTRPDGRYVNNFLFTA